MLSYLAQLVAVWVSGYLESACREAALNYTRNRASKNVVGYVGKVLKRFRNPNMNKILELIGDFDRDARDELKKFSQGRIESSVNSIVSQRHNIAHGRATQLTISQVRIYYKDVRCLVNKMRSLFS